MSNNIRALVKLLEQGLTVARINRPVVSFRLTTECRALLQAMAEHYKLPATPLGGQALEAALKDMLSLLNEQDRASVLSRAKSIEAATHKESE